MGGRVFTLFVRRAVLENNFLERRRDIRERFLDIEPPFLFHVKHLESVRLKEIDDYRSDIAEQGNPSGFIHFLNILKIDQIRKTTAPRPIKRSQCQIETFSINHLNKLRTEDSTALPIPVRPPRSPYPLRQCSAS